MADSYRMHELDDADINRLLPGEILEDIGVVVIDPAERQVPDVVDELAARLASVLGGAPKKTPCHHHPQVTVGRGSLDLAGGKGTVRRVMAVPPPFLPSPPAVPWQVMEGLMRRNSVVIHPTMPTMPGSTPTWPLAGGARPTTTAARRGTGTGVFFPRAEVARRTAKAARLPPLVNGNHARVIHQRGQQAAMVTVKSQQEMRAVAAHMERRHYLGVHVLPHQELALPLEWTY